MTVAFVQGNPATEAIWSPLLAVLGRDDAVLLSPPGFGAPLPDGFGATFLEYRDWLEAELEKIDGPIDLVGHDWGGGHVVNLVMHRPELVPVGFVTSSASSTPTTSGTTWRRYGRRPGWAKRCWRT